jgi:hypothetical protein
MNMRQFGASLSAREPESASAAIDVTYSRVAALDMWLPDSMTESYEVVRGAVWDRTKTEARYSNYRQFQTSGRIK